MPADQYRVSDQLHRTELAMGKAFGKVLRPLAISPAQAGVLLYLDRYPNTSSADLAQAMGITPQTMHRIVAALGRRSLVARERRAGDRRPLYAALTPTGKETLEAAEVALRTALDAVAMEFSRDEMDVLYRMLERFEALFGGRGSGGPAREP